MNLGETAGSATGRKGVVWSLEGSGDLNANLVRFGAGGGVLGDLGAATHQVSVLIVGVSGSGLVSVDGEEHPVSDGVMVFVPKGVRRSTLATSEGFAYLSVHRRRGPLRIGN